MDTAVVEGVPFSWHAADGGRRSFSELERGPYLFGAVNLFWEKPKKGVPFSWRTAYGGASVSLKGDSFFLAPSKLETRTRS